MHAHASSLTNITCTGVERLQTSYARYFRHGEAQVQPNWQLGISRKNYELAVRSGASFAELTFRLAHPSSCDLKTSCCLSPDYPCHSLRSDNQTFMPLLPNDHLLFSAHAPDSVSMRITQAPAEVSTCNAYRPPRHASHPRPTLQFTVPVKQDRRLSPSFKVKVDVK